MGYSVRKADISEDKKSIITFWNQNHEKSLDDKYNWIYENNPDGNATTWLLVHDDLDKIVGMATLFPRFFCINEKIFKAGIQGDLFVHPEHRSLGPAITLLKSLSQSDESKSCDFIYGLPNDKAKLICKRMGYKNIGSIVRNVRLCDSRRFLCDKGFPPFVATLGGAMINVLMRLMAPEFWYIDFGQHFFKVDDSLTDEYSLLWDKARKIGFTTCKPLSYMSWKYESDPDKKNTFFTLYDRSTEEMVGCIVFRQTNSAIEIRDIIYVDNNPSVISLVSLFLKYARKLKVESIYYTSLRKSVIDRELSYFDFTYRGDETSVYILINDDIPSNMEVKKLLSINNLILFASDQDT